MTTHQHTFTTLTSGRGMINITNSVAKFVSVTSVLTGMCNIFLHHTSASLILCENSDPDVQQDLESFMGRLAPDGDKLYKHTAEGPDDMPSHVRTVLTANSISIPITQKHLHLGTWQGIYIWEHRLDPHERKVTVTIQ